MKTKNLSLLSIVLALFASSTVAAPLGTAFTYQGRLTDGATVANGSYDMQFKLYDAAVGGLQIAATVPVAPVAVSNGLFTVQLDYGASSFAGDARWLEIGVRTNGSVAPHSTLLPRQELTPTPHALYAATAPVAANAVTTDKILNGTILGADMGNNTVGSAQLADSIELGAAAVNGQLDVYRTAAGTPAISLFGASSQISTYGSDGLEQIRLWGAGFGEILLHNSLAANNTAVLLSANGVSGGLLGLNNTNGSTRALLSGGNIGGALTLYQADGQTGAFLDGDNAGSGLLQLRNTNGGTRISLYGQSPTTTGGEISVLASNGTETVEIIGQATAATGGQITLSQDDGKIGAKLVAEDGSGEGASFFLNQSAGGLGLRLEGDYFNGGRGIFYNSKSNITVDIQGDGDVGLAGYMRLLNTNGSTRVTLIGQGSAGGGEIRLANTSASTRLNLFGQGPNAAGEISVLDTTGNETVEITGSYATNFGGRITVSQADGSVAAEIISEGYAGDGGLVSVRNAAGVEKIELDGDDGDGSPAVRLKNSAGATTITLDGDAGGNGRVTTEELQVTSVSATLAAGATLTPATGFVRITGSGGPVTLNATTAIANGSGAGLILVLEGTSDVNTVIVPDNANTRLAASRTLGLNDTLMLIWNGSDWVEISYTVN